MRAGLLRLSSTLFYSMIMLAAVSHNLKYTMSNSLRDCAEAPAACVVLYMASKLLNSCSYLI